MNKPKWFAVFRSRRMAVVFLLGFAGGLPYLLTGATLTVWMKDAHVDIKKIATLSLVGLAYTFKFTWAPLLDRYALPFLGRRRGWLLVTQLGLVASIAAMGFVDPAEDTDVLAAIAVAIAVFSASQDVVIDAYNAEILAPHERAAGSSLYVTGYRVALLLTGTLALILADPLRGGWYVPWKYIYPMMAAIMLLCISATLLAEEPVARRAPMSLVQSVYMPFVEFAKKLGWKTTVLVLFFTVSYKFGDYFLQSLLSPFLKSGAGFDFSNVKPDKFDDAWAQAVVDNVVRPGAGFKNTDIAVINKFVGFAAALVGGLSAGALVARYGIRRMLMAFGVLQALTLLLYAALALAAPRSFGLFALTVFSDNVAGAMGTAAFVSVLMSTCTPGVSATQFALLTSLSSVGHRVFGPFAGNVVESVGWPGYFISCALFAIPGLALALFVGRRVEREIDAKPPAPTA